MHATLLKSVYTDENHTESYYYYYFVCCKYILFYQSFILFHKISDMLYADLCVCVVLSCPILEK